MQTPSGQDLKQMLQKKLIDFNSALEYADYTVRTLGERFVLSDTKNQKTVHIFVDAEELLSTNWDQMLHMVEKYILSKETTWPIQRIASYFRLG